MSERESASERTSEHERDCSLIALAAERGAAQQVPTSVFQMNEIHIK